MAFVSSDKRSLRDDGLMNITLFEMLSIYASIYRAASGILSNIDHQKKNQISTKLFEISTTQHYIDQISTAKVPWKAHIYNIYF